LIEGLAASALVSETGFKFRRLVMTVVEYLDTCLADYGVTQHSIAYSAEALAHKEHVPNSNVAKPVLIKADGRFCMCVLPADRRIDLKLLKDQLNAKTLSIASEDEMVDLFPDCEVGTEPPFGIIYGIETYMDRSLENDKYIVFQGGTHDTAISMSMEEYERLAYPRVIDFTTEPRL
jgi:Ala-tRNA(Pro) deacylase